MKIDQALSKATLYIEFKMISFHSLLFIIYHHLANYSVTSFLPFVSRVPLVDLSLFVRLPVWDINILSFVAPPCCSSGPKPEEAPPLCY